MRNKHGQIRVRLPSVSLVYICLTRFHCPFQICLTVRLAAIRPRRAAPVIATRPVRRPSSCSARTRRRRQPTSLWMIRRPCRMRSMFERDPNERPRHGKDIPTYSKTRLHTHTPTLSLCCCVRVCGSSDYNINIYIHNIHIHVPYSAHMYVLTTSRPISMWCMCVCLILVKSMLLPPLAYRPAIQPANQQADTPHTHLTSIQYTVLIYYLRTYILYTCMCIHMYIHIFIYTLISISISKRCTTFQMHAELP